MKNVFTTKQKMVRLAYTTGLLSLVLAVALSLSAGGTLAANLFATAPGLGDAESFAVLGATAAAGTGVVTTIWGDLGLFPGLETSRTGEWNVLGDEYFGPGTLAETAQQDALAAYNYLEGQSPDGPFDSTTLNPTPGVYKATDSVTFASTLTLSGDYDAVWVFQIPVTLTFNGDVVMEGDAQACNVFWQVGTDVTIGSGFDFVGTIIASRDISLISGATVSGRIISLNRDISVDGNTITYPPCEEAAEPRPTAVPTEEPAAATPETLLPDTGGDLAGPGSQITRISLGALGLTLILFAFMLSRRTQKAER